MRKGEVAVEIDSAYWGGYYVASMERVAARMAVMGKRRMVRACMDCWPEIAGHTSARMWLRRQPSYVLAIILEQR